MAPLNLVNTDPGMMDQRLFSAKPTMLTYCSWNFLKQTLQIVIKIRCFSFKKNLKKLRIGLFLYLNAVTHVVTL